MPVLCVTHGQLLSILTMVSRLEDNVYVNDFFRPQYLVGSVCELEPSLFQACGVQGVLLDMDNTLAPWRHPEVMPEIIAWGQRLHAAGLSACVVTNAAHPRLVAPVAEQLGFSWVHRAVKPLSRGIRRGMEMLGTTPRTTAMVGDQLFTDILGGNRLGLTTMLVNPLVHHNEDFLTRQILRRLERLFVCRP